MIYFENCLTEESAHTHDAGGLNLDCECTWNTGLAAARGEAALNPEGVGAPKIGIKNGTIEFPVYGNSGEYIRLAPGEKKSIPTGILNPGSSDKEYSYYISIREAVGGESVLIVRSAGGEGA